jgi:uncharacterized metal-binding protein
MPSYKMHDGITIYSACALGPVCYWAINQYAPTVGGYAFTSAPLTTTLLVVGAYLFSGLLLSNDLDTYSRPYRRWGPLRILWYPYQRLVAHRSVLSHGVLIGPVLRVVYLYAMVEVLLCVIYHGAILAGYSTQMAQTGLRMVANVFPYLVAHPQVSMPLLVGLVLGGITHSIIDWF